MYMRSFSFIKSLFYVLYKYILYMSYVMFITGLSYSKIYFKKVTNSIKTLLIGKFTRS